MTLNLHSQNLFDDAKQRIGSFIESAIKKEISWITLASILKEMANNLSKSKQMIEIVLHILQSKLQDDPISNEDTTHEYISEESDCQEPLKIEFDEDGIDPLKETPAIVEAENYTNFVCEFCDKVFYLNIAYKKHMKNHIHLMNNIEESNKTKLAETSTKKSWEGKNLKFLF